MQVKFKTLHPNAVIPSYSLEGDAGLDLTSIEMDYDTSGNIVYKTGLAVEIPKGFVGLIFPRSSISKRTLYLTNSVGVIDSNYRGEIIVKFKTAANTVLKVSTCDGNRTVLGVENYNEYYYRDRIAQLIIIPLPNIMPIEAEELSETIRGSGGFGSTGN